MPAATTKADLVAATHSEFAKLQRLISDIPDDIALRKRDENTSIKDVIAHRAHWIDLFLGWYQDGQAGHEVYFPAKGYLWSDLRVYNANLRQEQAALDWAAAKALLVSRHDILAQFINSLSEAQLYGGPMMGARNTWTTGRFAQAAGASHYRSAAKWIRAELRADLQQTGAAAKLG